MGGGAQVFVTVTPARLDRDAQGDALELLWTEGWAPGNPEFDLRLNLTRELPLHARNVSMPVVHACEIRIEIARFGAGSLGLHLDISPYHLFGGRAADVFADKRWVESSGQRRSHAIVRRTPSRISSITESLSPSSSRRTLTTTRYPLNCARSTLQ